MPGAPGDVRLGSWGVELLDFGNLCFSFFRFVFSKKNFCRCVCIGLVVLPGGVKWSGGIWGTVEGSGVAAE